ncbi:ABC transporter ATP-binding protein [Desulfosporosinus fructosivorans]|uniref:ABC transporter ATP-binding protein n=1 Tax=Desulfosporosinus fructosivorans TaxID=2018669 RepID=A0A4Z0RA48_9FIRM|nr:ABC transporter ATP-binding protein [Desulfosporosinus fructosivorans]TGE38913.1 ABC transporter ATP-binding protein [Desulfosporosinus fructosivorans]
MKSILKISDLSKSYGGEYAVQNLNMHITQGDIYGFLGQNGSGKTTTIRMILGLIEPTSGYVELFGEPVSKRNYQVFRRIGSMVEYPGAYENLTAVENLEIHRKLMGIKKRDSVEEVLHLVGLSEARNKKVGEFSLGMKQRLGIGRTLLHKPELLVLDEPTNGLDPVGIKEIRELIVTLAKRDKITILVSSHLLSEIEQMATKIGIINKGLLLEEITLDSLIKKSERYIRVKVNDADAAIECLTKNLNIKEFTVENGVLKVYERLQEAVDINRLLVTNNIDVEEICLIEDKLEDYFLKLIGGLV